MSKKDSYKNIKHIPYVSILKGCVYVKQPLSYHHNIMKNDTNPADPTTIKKFVDPLPIPKVLAPTRYGNHGEAFYKITMRETNHQFHKDFSSRKVWGYNGICPGPTIEANKDSPIQVEWVNQLSKKHLLPVDHTLHGTMDTPDVRTVVH